jgi:MFS family permease
MALQMTGSGERLGFIMVLLYLPALVLAIPAGVLADRYPKRNLLLFTQGSMMLAAGVMATLLHEDKIVYPHVAVFALIFGCLAAIGNPIRLAFNVEMASQGNSAQAVSLNAMSFNLARLLGPSIAGLIILNWGVFGAFCANALSYIPLLLFVGFLPCGQASASGKGSPFKQAMEGMQYVRNEPTALNIVLLMSWLGIFAINWNTVVPAYARLVLHLGAEGYGFILSCVGAGALCGSVWQSLRREMKPRQLLWSGAVIGLVYVALMRRLEPPELAGLLLIAGFATVVTLTTANSALQLLAPRHLSGRMMSIYLLIVFGTNPLGGYLAGLMFEHFGGRIACGLLGGITLAGVLALALRNWTEHIEDGHKH